MLAICSHCKMVFIYPPLTNQHYHPWEKKKGGRRERLWFSFLIIIIWWCSVQSWRIFHATIIIICVVCVFVCKHVHRCQFECRFVHIIVRACAAAVREYLCASVLLNNPSFYIGLWYLLISLLWSIIYLVTVHVYQHWHFWNISLNVPTWVQQIIFACLHKYCISEAVGANHSLDIHDPPILGKIGLEPTNISQ